MFHHCPILYIAPISHIEIHLSPVEHVAKMQTLILGIGFEWDNDNIEDQNIEKQTLQDHWGPLKICLDLFRVVVCCRRAWQVLSHVAATPWDSDGSAVDLWGYIPICALPSDWTWLNCTVNHKTWGCLWCEVYVLYSTVYRLYSCVMMYYRSFFTHKKYFTSCDPHHDIYTFCYWQIFWHSIWHIFWHSIWHIFWHSIWHIFWHIIHTNLLAFYLANILALYLAYLLAFYLTFYLAFYLAYLLAIYLAYLLTFYLAYHLANLMAFYLAYLLAFYLTFYLAYLLAFYLAFEVQRCALSSEGPRLRFSGAHWARQVSGWGPAVRTELGRSQVEVQRCALSWEGPRLRSSSAHWAPKLAKSLAKSWQGNSGRGSGGRGGRRGGGRGGGGGGRRRRRTTLIKSNNPHLAGGESTKDWPNQVDRWVARPASFCCSQVDVWVIVGLA